VSTAGALPLEFADVTEPDPRASPVRRTVLVALALVAGQLALCAVIGWLTFGDRWHPASTTAPGVAAPPAGGADEPPRVRPGSRTPAPTRPVKARRSVDPEPGAVRTAVPPPPRRSRPTRGAAPVSPAPVRTPTPDAALVPPEPSPQIQEPVRPDTSCAPVNAEGRTADGKPVRCLRARDGVLRWHLTR
jgi:hypothetical protein